MGVEPPDVVEGVDLGPDASGWLDAVLDAVRVMGQAPDLPSTLQAALAGLRDVGGFGAAAINVTQPNGVLRVDAVSDGVDALLGEETDHQVWLDLLDAAQRWRGLRFYRHHEDQSLVDPLVSWFPPARDAPPDGSDPWHPQDLLLAPMWGPDDELVGVISVDEPVGGRFPDDGQLAVLELLAGQAGRAILDATRRARTEDRALLFAAAFEEASAAMLVLDGDGAVEAANAAARALLGPTDQRRYLDLIAASERQAAHEHLERSWRGAAGAAELRVAARGETWVRVRGATVAGDAGPARLVLHLDDVTEARRRLGELRHLADHDSLTGLPNRRAADRALARALAEAGPDQEVVVLLADVDRFKEVNDTLGHAAGDDLLVQVAERLARASRANDVLARLGGDELLLVAVVDGDQEEAVPLLADRFVAALRPPFDLRAGRCQVSLSVGIARQRTDAAEDAAALVERADRALYRAKRAGRDRWSEAPAPGAAARAPA